MHHRRRYTVRAQRCRSRPRGALWELSNVPCFQFSCEASLLGAFCRRRPLHGPYYVGVGAESPRGSGYLCRPWQRGRVPEHLGCGSPGAPLEPDISSCRRNSLASCTVPGSRALHAKPLERETCSKTLVARILSTNTPGAVPSPLPALIPLTPPHTPPPFVPRKRNLPLRPLPQLPTAAACVHVQNVRAPPSLPSAERAAQSTPTPPFPPPFPPATSATSVQPRSELCLRVHLPLFLSHRTPAPCRPSPAPCSSQAAARNSRLKCHFPRPR